MRPVPHALTSFAAFATWLESHGLFHMELGLERMAQALERLDLRQPAPLSIQVVGTNGKGSTATLLAALATAHGQRAGLYTSPHFLTVRERLRIDSAMLSEDAWLAAATPVVPLAQELGLTYFEILTVVAAQAFRTAGVEVAVFEAGLGGRHDATSALHHQGLCLTPMGLDHQQVLGPTLGHIAADKAGAMRPGQAVFCGPQPAEALAVIQEQAQRLGVQFHGPEAIAPLPEDQPLAMAGPHQRANAALALAAWRYLCPRLGLASDPRQEWAALASAAIAGRFQRIPRGPGRPELILDGAHNQDGLRVLAATLQALGLTPGAVVFSCFKDKDVAEMARLVAALTPGPILVPPISYAARAADPAEVAAAVGPRARAVAHLPTALAQAEAAALAVHGPVVVCGSLYLLADVYTFLPGARAHLALSEPLP